MTKLLEGEVEAKGYVKGTRLFPDLQPDWSKARTLNDFRSADRAFIKRIRALRRKVGAKHFVDHGALSAAEGRIKYWDLATYKEDRDITSALSRVSTGGTGYHAGKSCGRGKHDFEDRGTYFKCRKCGSSRTKHEPKSQMKSSRARRRVERL